MQASINFYKQQQVQSEVSNSDNLVVVLYERVIQNLRDINVAIEYKDVQSKLRLVNNTLDIIQMGLIGCLTKEYDEKLYNALYDFYDVSVQEIIVANLKNDETIFNRVRGNFENMKDSWNRKENSTAVRTH